jgi:hypothetical protein
VITLTQEQAAELVQSFGKFVIDPSYAKHFDMLVRPAIFQQVLTNKSFADCNDLAWSAVAYLDMDEHFVDEFETIARNLLEVC